MQARAVKKTLISYTTEGNFLTGAEFSTPASEINGGPLSARRFFSAWDLAKNLIEQRRPWMVLRRFGRQKQQQPPTPVDRNRLIHQY
jgi:hypothetical protein